MGQTNAHNISVYLIEDNEMFRLALAEAIANQEHLEVVGQASSFDESMPSLLKLNPNVILMDIEMPGVNGIEATRMICEKKWQSKVVILSVHEDGERVTEAFRAGANGYILKSYSLQTVFDSIKAVASGHGYIDAHIAQLMARAIEDYRVMEEEVLMWRRKQLTRREIEILRLVSQGFTNDQIAKHLYISSKTVKNHLSHVYQKLCCGDRTQAVLKAMKAGLFEEDHSPGFFRADC